MKKIRFFGCRSEKCTPKKAAPDALAPSGIPLATPLLKREILKNFREGQESENPGISNCPQLFQNLSMKMSYILTFAFINLHVCRPDPPLVPTFTSSEFLGVVAFGDSGSPMNFQNKKLFRSRASPEPLLCSDAARYLAADLNFHVSHAKG